MGIKHTQKCIEAQENYQKSIVIFDAEHPHVCKTCNGYGAIDGGTQSVPYGNGNVMMPLGAEPCPDCSEKGICPHCGEQTLNDDNEYAHCSKCGWNAENPQHIRPTEPECYCWEDQLDSYLQTGF